MLLDGLAQGTGPLTMYDADVFQMCQISVVQIFIEGGEGFVRISYATSEENIREGLKRIAEFVASLP